MPYLKTRFENQVKSSSIWLKSHCFLLYIATILLPCISFSEYFCLNIFETPPPPPHTHTHTHTHRDTKTPSSDLLACLLFYSFYCFTVDFLFKLACFRLSIGLYLQWNKLFGLGLWFNYQKFVTTKSVAYALFKDMF